MDNSLSTVVLKKNAEGEAKKNVEQNDCSVAGAKTPVSPRCLLDHHSVWYGILVCASVCARVMLTLFASLYVTGAAE